MRSVTPLIVLILGTTCLPTARCAQQLTAAIPPSTSSVRGEVLDRDGSVCEGARVELRAASSASRSVISDADGKFDFDAVAPGSFSLAVTAIGFASETVTGTVVRGQDLALASIVLRPTSVSDVFVSADPTLIATEELHVEETQRVLGFIPNFNVVYDHNAPPLTSRQKFQLALRSAIDPVTLASIGGSAGIQMADGTLNDYGNGAAGFARRYGVDFGDNLIGTMIGGAILPSLLHQDPRYIYKGTGSKSSRFGYALATAFICKGDNGHWQPNYSNLLGNFAAAGISNAYYPASDRNGGRVIAENFALNKLSDAVQNVFQEFVVRHFTRNKPSYATAP